MPLFVSKRYLNLLEKELAYYRLKSEKAEERADRLHDALLTQCGQLPVTEVVRVESKTQQSAADKAFQEHQAELREMFAETMEDCGETLPPEYEADAAQINGEQDGAAR